MKRLLFILITALIFIGLTGCKSDIQQNTSDNANQGADSQIDIDKTQGSSLYYDKVDDEGISVTLGSDPILPNVKYNLVKKWLEDEDTEGLKLFKLFLAPNESDVWILATDSFSNISYWTYFSQNGELRITDWTFGWAEGVTVSERSAQSNNNLEEYLDIGIVTPYISGNALRETVKNELNDEFSVAPKQGELFVLKAYDNYFALFGAVSENNLWKTVCFYYNYDYELLGKDVYVKDGDTVEFIDSLTPLRKSNVQ